MRSFRGLVIGFAVVVLAGCANGQAGTRQQGGTPVDVAALVGTWAVTAVGAEPSVLILEPRWLELRLAADTRSGTWRATPDGTFLAHITAAGGPEPDASTPAWLQRSSTVEADGPDRLLRDDAATVTARLTPDGPAPGISDDDRRFLLPPAPLPAALSPADGTRLRGRWQPRAGTRAVQRPFVEFEAGMSWTGSDGCNGAFGRWTSGPGGLLLATSGPMTLIGCEDMVGVPGWLALAARAGFDGETLVLLDGAGEELGRLDRA